MKACKKGLTLTEAAIVVAMLAIVSIIVVPELSQASPGAQEASLVDGLQSLRAAIREYREDHDGKLPEGEILTGQLTMRTNAVGEIAPIGGDRDDYRFGPYLQSMPSNPFVNSRISSTVEVGRETPGGGNAGWYFNVRTGVIYADDDVHAGL